MVRCVQPLFTMIFLYLSLLYVFPLNWRYFYQGSGGVTIKKTNQALVIGVYDEPLAPGQCNMIVERLGDYLYDQGL
jgi:hypothetical protein